MKYCKKRLTTVLDAFSADQHGSTELSGFVDIVLHARKTFAGHLLPEPTFLAELQAALEEFLTLHFQEEMFLAKNKDGPGAALTQIIKVVRRLLLDVQRIWAYFRSVSVYVIIAVRLLWPVPIWSLRRIT